MKLLDISTKLEENSDIHLMRLFILIGVFAGKKGEKTINGLTKLAKLDFLLRYPVYLEQAMIKKNITIEKLEIKNYERYSIESAMVRYRYGPWDFRYRNFINVLIGKGLVNVIIEDRTINISITKKGLGLFSSISKSENLKDTINRAHILKANFDISGSNLKKFIYDSFPEITSLRLGETIKYEN